MEKKTILTGTGIAAIAGIAGWAIGRFVKTEKSDEEVIPAAEANKIAEDAKEVSDSSTEDAED